MAGCMVVLVTLVLVSVFVVGIKTTGTIAAIALTVTAVMLVVGRIAGARERTQRADGSFARQYMYVEDDGSARELAPAELEHLNTEFDGADGNRPYIKRRYSSLTPDHRMRGYLLRRKLPNYAEIKPSPAAPEA